MLNSDWIPLILYRKYCILYINIAKNRIFVYFFYNIIFFTAYIVWFVSHERGTYRIKECENNSNFIYFDLGRSQATPSMWLTSDWDGAQALRSIEIRMQSTFYKLRNTISHFLVNQRNSVK